MDLTNPIFVDDNAAREHLEAILWPDGPVCPHCGSVENIKRLKGKSHRPGLHQCNSCRGHFTVMVGTVLERSKIPLHKWVLGFQLIASSKKGISAHQLHRMLGVTYKTAWFMAHRIREAMGNTNSGPLGGEGQTVEADATFYGPRGYDFTNSEGWVEKQGAGNKSRIHTTVERGGRVRSRVVKDLTVKTLRHALVTNVDRKSTLMTDDAGVYRTIGKEFKKHHAITHSHKQYVLGDVSTNVVEGYFSIFKRGMRGIYQHCGEQHLQCYLNEFDFRYSHRKATDAERAVVALKGIEGKRLTYRRTNGLT
jgi:transposase-like protein